MRLRTFTAPDMNRAMLMIRETLGDDAVIISTARDSGGKSVSVTAAVDEDVRAEWDDEEAAFAQEVEDAAPDYPPGGLGQYLAASKRARERQERPVAAESKPPLMSRDAILGNRELAHWLNELEQVLLFHSVPPLLVEQMLRTARHLDIHAQKDVESALAALLEQLYHFAPLGLAAAQGKAPRIMLVGPPGTGKTLAVAKIAADLVADGLPIHVVTIDNKRAGSVEQLRAFTHIMGLETVVADSRNALRQALRECPEGEPVVIDSFGTNPYSFAELKELTDFANLHGIEPVLVLAAGGDAQEAEDVARAFAFLGIRRLLVTRADSARRLGAMLSAAESSGLALCDMTTSPQVAGGFLPLDKDVLSEALLRHRTEQ